MKIAPDPTDPLIPSWRQRPKPVGYELLYVIEGDELVIDSTRKIDRVRLGAIEQVRFTFAPGNISSRGYRLELRLVDGKTITIGDQSWKSMVNIERDPPRYRRFVEALCAGVARQNPSSRFVAGFSQAKWLAVAVLATTSILSMATFAVLAWKKGQSNAAWLTLFLTCAGAWQMWPLVMLNQPKSLKTGEIPAWLMP